MTAQPLNSEPALGPVEGRGVAEIRADLATCEQLGIVPWPAAARRLLADVPSLLAGVEAAHRFERSVAVDSARLAAVEALVTDAECSVGWLSHADADWRVKAVRACDLRVALAAAADAPQPKTEARTKCLCGHDAALHAKSEPRACTESNDRDWYCPCRSLRGPSPAVLPEKEPKEQRDV